MTYIWDHLGVEKKQWKALCERVWTRVFQSEDILQGMDEEEIENRHEMQRKASVVMVNDIKEKMQQNVNWDEYNYKESKFSRSVFSKEKRLQQKKAQKLNDYYAGNKAEMLNLNKIAKI